jgi:uncharacterized protein (DUF1800 family)
MDTAPRLKPTDAGMRPLIGLARAVVLMMAVAACSAAPPGGGPAGSPAPPRPASRLALPASPLGEDERIVHVLDRLGYGPRPGDVERVRRIGLAAHIDAQLHPERIADDPTESALRAYSTLAMTTAALLRDFPRADPALQRRIEAGEMSPRELREVYPPERRPARIVGELQAARLVRAVSSERQLQEVMVDFWLNHFNVFSQKGAVRWMLTSYERDAIRPHALGRFRDLLLATARHPAMLFYLDNWLSVRPGLVIPAGPNAGRQAGLNENYARELMELHTLGVDGGYTQADVVEVARCFTGWSIDRPALEGRFAYRPRAHDDGDKRVLGHAIPAGGGEGDGLRVIEILSRHPATARLVASKLARRFVSDAPPPALVERAAGRFARTGGDIRTVLETIVTSPEFFSAEAPRAKIKTPLELVASAVRAVDGRLVPAPEGAGDALAADGGATLARAVARLGQPLYGAQPPTGYADLAEAWVNTGALVARMNFALTLAHGRYAGTRLDLGALVGDADRGQPGAVLDRLLIALLHGRAAPETREVLARQLGAMPAARAVADRGTETRGGDARGTADVARVTALVLGSPEFQRR